MGEKKQLQRDKGRLSSKRKKKKKQSLFLGVPANMMYIAMD